jgi:hypothetical protein
MSFNTLLNDFANYLDFLSSGSKKSYLGYVKRVDLSPGSQKSYLRYVKRVDEENKGMTLQWLKDAATNADPLGELSKKFDNFFNGKPILPKTKSNWKTGLLTLGKFVFGFNKSSINLQGIKNFDLVACQLIAQTAIFCPKHIYEDVKNGKCGSKDNQPKGNAFGSWFNCKYRRATNVKSRRQTINGIILDDNTMANQAIKKAVLKGLEKYGIHKTDIKIFKGFEACHIWEKTCYDERYHTSVANLVLIPREIAGLTDHCDAVKELLKYESFNRFGFLPNVDNNGVIIQMQQPVEPNIYNSLTWRTTPTP